MKCKLCGEFGHLQKNCSAAASQEPKKDNEKKEVSEARVADDESKKSEQASGGAKGPGLMRRKSSVMFICYTLSFKNGSKITNEKK